MGGILSPLLIYMFNIISNHVFQDGNKRTGLESALVFLKLNEYNIKNQLIRIKNPERERVHQKD